MSRKMIFFGVMFLLAAWLCAEDTPVTIRPSAPSSTVPVASDLADIGTEAEAGDPESQLWMGVFCANGHGLPQNFNHAAVWFRKSAKQGNARAQRNLGLLLECGLGLPADPAEALECYLAAAEQNEPAAFIGVSGFIYRNSLSAFPKSFRWQEARVAYNPSALVFDPDNPSSAFLGGFRAWRGKAYALLGMDLAAAGFENNFWREYNRGEKYFLEQGKIVDALRNRAEENDADAQLALGVLLLGDSLFYNGNPDNEACIQITLAADNGNPHAKHILASYSNQYYKCPVFPDERERLLAEAAAEEAEPWFVYEYMRKSVSLNWTGEMRFPIKDIPVTMDRLADAGYAPAQYVKAVLSPEKKWQDVMDALEVPAAAGCPEALAFFVGAAWRYADGKGMEKADKLVKEMVLSNDLRFQRVLKQLLEDSGKLTIRRVLNWYRLRKGEKPHAKFLLGMYEELCNNDYDAAWLRYCEALDAGLPRAAYQLGELCRSGRGASDADALPGHNGATAKRIAQIKRVAAAIGFDKGRESALAWWLAGAEYGDVPSLFAVAFYLNNIYWQNCHPGDGFEEIRDDLHSLVTGLDAQFLQTSGWHDVHIDPEPSIDDRDPFVRTSSSGRDLDSYFMNILLYNGCSGASVR